MYRYLYYRNNSRYCTQADNYDLNKIVFRTEPCKCATAGKYFEFNDSMVLKKLTFNVVDVVYGYSVASDCKKIVVFLLRLLIPLM